MTSPSYLEIFLVSILLIIPFLYETSHVFRYYLKFFVYYAVIMVNSVLVLPIMIFKPCDVKNLLLASTICHPISNVLGIRWQLRGREYLQKDEAYIIVANHQSSLDILGMFDIWPIMDKCTVVAKKQLLYVWPFGISAWLCGLIFIERLNSDKTRNTLNEATEKIKTKKIKLWVFPEGTRKNTGDIHPFKKGAFHIAIKSEIPILPVVFSSYYFLNDQEKRLDNGEVIITTLPPIPTKGLKPEDIDDLMDKTRNIMIDTFNASTKEVTDSLLKPLTPTSQ